MVVVGAAVVVVVVGAAVVVVGAAVVVVVVVVGAAVVVVVVGAAVVVVVVGAAVVVVVVGAAVVVVVVGAAVVVVVVVVVVVLVVVMTRFSTGWRLTHACNEPSAAESCLMKSLFSGVQTTWFLMDAPLLAPNQSRSLTSLPSWSTKTYRDAVLAEITNLWTT